MSYHSIDEHSNRSSTVVSLHHQNEALLVHIYNYVEEYNGMEFIAGGNFFERRSFSRYALIML